MSYIVRENSHGVTETQRWDRLSGEKIINVKKNEKYIMSSLAPAVLKQSSDSKQDFSEIDKEEFQRSLTRNSLGEFSKDDYTILVKMSLPRDKVKVLDKKAIADFKKCQSKKSIRQEDNTVAGFCMVTSADPPESIESKKDEIKRILGEDKKHHEELSPQQFLMKTKILTTIEIVEVIEGLIERDELHKSLVLKRLSTFVETRRDIIDYVVSLVREKNYTKTKIKLQYTLI